MVPRAIKSLTTLAVVAIAISGSFRQPLDGINSQGDAAQSSSPLSQENDPDPTDFSAEELELLQRRFGVHGPQTQLAQLFTRGIDQFQPLRANTLSRLNRLKPSIQREAARHRINPMLITAILFDEIQHSKPGEDLPFVVHSGLVETHGPAQLGISELIHQGRLPADPTYQQIAAARDLLMDPDANIELLAAKLSRLKGELGLERDSILIASRSYVDAKAIAILAYLHNGKLDYPARVLRYMQDPALHGLIYSRIRPKPLPLI
ncbi:helicase DnaB [Synechococcus sp. MIT S9507]|uniref:helicase DnaB n=1 Tax=Synechococcus sp. MIT S9507 TaxID=3082544 RepID=UPI0039B6A726